LQLVDIPQLLAEQVRVARATNQAKIDPREAFIDAMLLVVPGVVGETSVWTDGLNIDGIVLQAAAETPITSTPETPQGWRGNQFVATPAAAPRPLLSIERRGTTITVAGRPFFARGIRWREEPLDFLAARGFNCIWTDQTLTESDMSEAARANVWFVCRPPRPDTIATEGLPMPLDRVLAWNLGTPQSRHDLEYFRRWADLIHERDSLPMRPVIVSPNADWWPASKIADVLLARHPASSQLTKVDFGTWLAALPLLTQPATPFWVAVPTQPGEAVRRQLAAITRRPQSSAAVHESIIGELACTAAMSGCRGIMFDSDAPLDTTDEATSSRALALESINRQLQLIEPWLTSGKNVGQAVAIDAPTTAIVLQVERARLVVPANWRSAAVVQQRPAAYIVPGTPETNQAFALTPGGLRPLESKRIAGGVRVEMTGDANSLVLLTDDPALVASLRQRIARDSRRALQLERDLAVMRARSLVVAARRLEQFGQTSRDSLQTIGAANALLSQCHALAATGNLADAYQRAESARHLLASAAIQQYQNTSPNPLESWPVGAAYGALAEQLELQRTIAPLRGGENLLEGGDFESLAELKRTGWQNVVDPLAGIVANVELSPREPYLGRYSLELSARAEATTNAPQIIARPLVWIISPPVRVSGDQFVEITGWARVSEPIHGSVDVLSITDSLGGPELAMRIKATTGWQPFRIIRGTSEPCEVSVTMALAGLGAATIDGLSIRTLAAPSTKRLPPITSTPQPPLAPIPEMQSADPKYPTSSAQLQGPLFIAPISR
jgi:hypothetical protein